MINTQHWENDDRQNQKYLGRGANPCIAVYHKSEMHGLGQRHGLSVKGWCLTTSRMAHKSQHLCHLLISNTFLLLHPLQ